MPEGYSRWTGPIFFAKTVFIVIPLHFGTVYLLSALHLWLVKHYGSGIPRPLVIVIILGLLWLTIKLVIAKDFQKLREETAARKAAKSSR